MTQSQIIDKSEGVILEALNDCKIPQFEVEHIMSLVKSYGDIRTLEGKADGIERAMSVKFPNPNTYPLLHGTAMEQAETNAIQNSLNA